MIRDIALRLAALSLLWWVISEARAGAMAFGAVMVALTLILSFRVAPAPLPAINGVAVLRFVPYFLWESLRGGVDVVRRAVHPSMPLSPGVVAYPLRLQGRGPRVLFVVTASLLPGTLAARIDDDGRFVRVHCLDTTMAIFRNLAEIETRVAAVFRQPTQPAPTPSH